MKKILCVIFVMTGFFSFAQSRQVKMYLEAIAANGMYEQYLKKAISIAKTGLTTIGDIRNGEFKLHDVFFKGLTAVNPKIRNWNKVADIISCQINTLKSYQDCYSRILASGQFTPSELQYIKAVFARLLDDCGAIIVMLADILSNDRYKMSDDERMKRIETLYATMLSSYRFCQTFSKNNLMLATQRLKEQNEISVSKQLFDIH